jgi:uncharacterized RDD family membrane protein YckC
VPREVTVVTPENIPLHLELAGLGSRFGALLVDLAIQAVTLLVVLIVAGIVAAFTQSFWGTAAGRALSGWVTAGAILLAFIILFGYFILFETVWNGQTPGKKIFNLRVVRDGGYPLTFLASATRNLVRLADFLPVAFAAGALSVFFHAQYKRLGDLAAGTLVVKERPVFSLMPFGAAVAPGAAAAGPQAGGEAAATLARAGIRHPSDELTRDEQDLLRRFARRRWEMAPDDAERLAYRLVVPLVPRLNLTFVAGAPPRYADLVSVLVAALDARDDAAA